MCIFAIALRAVFEALGLISGFHDLAVMGQAVEKCHCHLGVTEHRRPFTECQVRRDDDRGALVEPADEVEQELTSGLRERQIAEFVEDDKVEACEIIGYSTLLAVARFRFKSIDQIDDVEEAAARTVAYECPGNRDSQVALARSPAADENNVALIGNEGAGGQFPHQDFIDGRVGEVEVVDVFCQRQLGNTELVVNGPGLFLGDLRLQEVADDARWFVLPPDAIAHDLVVGAAYSVELQRAHQF